mmetsp:Transcript_6729/g.23688  ORF Transcript_6729/g.23688 Transcript_6729/m.23688 type:complete len:92 (+) Transcript_6729:210-485(+)
MLSRVWISRSQRKRRMKASSCETTFGCSGNKREDPRDVFFPVSHPNIRFCRLFFFGVLLKGFLFAIYLTAKIVFFLIIFITLAVITKTLSS